jgi:hypothetical protein
MPGSVQKGNPTSNDLHRAVAWVLFALLVVAQYPIPFLSPFHKPALNSLSYQVPDRVLPLALSGKADKLRPADPVREDAQYPLYSISLVAYATLYEKIFGSRAGAHFLLPILLRLVLLCAVFLLARALIKDWLFVLTALIVASTLFIATFSETGPLPEHFAAILCIYGMWLYVLALKVDNDWLFIFALTVFLLAVNFHLSAAIIFPLIFVHLVLSAATARIVRPTGPINFLNKIIGLVIFCTFVALLYKQLLPTYDDRYLFIKNTVLETLGRTRLWYFYAAYFLEPVYLWLYLLGSGCVIVNLVICLRKRLPEAYIMNLLLVIGVLYIPLCSVVFPINNHTRMYHCGVYFTGLTIGFSIYYLWMIADRQAAWSRIFGRSALISVLVLATAHYICDMEARRNEARLFSTMKECCYVIDPYSYPAMRVLRFLDLIPPPSEATIDAVLQRPDIKTTRYITTGDYYASLVKSDPEKARAFRKIRTFDARYSVHFLVNASTWGVQNLSSDWNRFLRCVVALDRWVAFEVVRPEGPRTGGE